MCFSCAASVPRKPDLSPAEAAGDGQMAAVPNEQRIKGLLCVAAGGNMWKEPCSFRFCQFDGLLFRRLQA